MCVGNPVMLQVYRLSLEWIHVRFLYDQLVRGLPADIGLETNRRSGCIAFVSRYDDFSKGRLLPERHQVGSG